MIPTICPEDHELLPLASDELASHEVTSHVAGCPACRERVDRLTAEVRSLRRSSTEVSTPPGEGPDPPGGSGSGSGRSGATEDWTPPASTSTATPDSEASAGSGSTGWRPRCARCDGTGRRC